MSSRLRPMTAVAVLVTCLVLVGGCAGPGADRSSPAAGGPTVAIQQCGRTEQFRVGAQRVAITAPPIADTLFDLGAGERIVALSGTAVAPVSPGLRDRMAAVPNVGPRVPGTEPLLATRPDLVIVAYGYHVDAAQGGASVEQLRAAGAQVYYTRGACAAGLSAGSGDDVDGVLADITQIGAILGIPDRAAQLTGRLRASLDEVAARTAPLPRVRGAQLSVVANQLYATTGGLSNDILRTAGMQNLFDDAGQQYIPVSPELVAARNPQALIIPRFATDPGGAGQLDYLRRTYPNTDAVRNDRLLVVDSAQGGTGPASTRTIRTVQEFAHFLYPDAVPAPQA